jgi:putative ABC transport system permease protein
VLNTLRIDTLWLKTWRDLWQNKGRSTLVVLSIALSTFTLGIILNSYAVLSREMTKDYLASRPAAISFGLSAFDKKLLQQIKAHPDVDKVDARRSIWAEIKTKEGEWQDLLLFVLHDYQNIQLGIVKPQQGSWPPKQDQILIERQATSLLGASINDTVAIKTRSGLSAQLIMSGTSHDIGLPQAEWENIVYGYISAQTLTAMGAEGYFNQLKISLKNKELTTEQMSSVANDLKQLLVELGHQVKSINIALPGEHPHANITGGMFMIQKVFAILCCLLSAVLVFNLMSAMLNKQVKQIGLMKAIGANQHQIRYIYFRGIFSLGLIAMLISLPAAYWLSKQYVDTLSPMMNFTISSYHTPLWIIVTQLCLGLGIPLFTAYLPINKASKMTIRETFIEYNSKLDNFGNSLFERFILMLNFVSHPVRLALRNALRQKGRFILTTGVLMFAAALLMATFNIASTMNNVVKVERESKAWGVAVKFQQKLSQQKLQSLIAGIPNILASEAFNRLSAAIIENDPAQRNPLPANKAEQHKVLVTLTDLKADSNMLSPPIISGRWLSSDKSATLNDIVVSQMVIKHLPYLKLGSIIDVEIAGKKVAFNIVGVVRKIGTASIYTRNAVDNLLNNSLKEKQTIHNGLFITAKDNSQAALKQLNKAVNLAAEDQKIKISYSNSAWDGADIVEDHFEIIFSLMLLLSVIIIFIASNGIILTMTTNIIERTRETGILKAIGASNGDLTKMVLTEALLIALLAWLLACIVTLPLSYGVAYWLGLLIIQTPFSLSLDLMIFLYTLPVMMLVTAVASLMPVSYIIKSPVREALLYE